MNSRIANKTRMRILLSSFVLIVLLFITFIVWDVIRDSLNQRLNVIFQEEVDKTNILIRDQIDEYATVLYGLRGLFSSYPEVTRTQWQNYFGQLGLMRRIPGMKLLSYSVYVKANQRELFISRVRNDDTISKSGFPNFTISSLPYRIDEEKQNTQDYLVMNYIWHWESNEMMHGLDLLSDTACLDFVEQIRNSGLMNISARTNINIDGEKNKAEFIIGLPVYQFGFPVESVEERRNGFKGILFELFIAEDLLKSILEKTVRYPNIDLEVYDGDIPKGENLYYNDDDILQCIDPHYQPQFSATVPLGVFGRSWTLYFSTTPGFKLQKPAVYLPHLAMGSGILFSFLITGIFFMLITSRDRAVSLADKINQKYEEQRALSIRADRLRSLGEMAAGIAHELNQPLVGVRGLAEHILIGLERGWKMDEKNIQEKIGTIVDQADRMSHIIEHVRIFAREAGKMEVQSIHVNDVVKSSTDLLKAQFSAHGLSLDVALENDLPHVLVNPFSLEEVLLNLILNGRDGVEARLKIEPHLVSPGIMIQTKLEKENDKATVIVQVIDNGIGIPNNIINKIFDPFFTTKDPDKGTGLGLSISKTMIEEFGGKLEIESVPMHSTVVTISLPAVHFTDNGGSMNG